MTKESIMRKFAIFVPHFKEDSVMFDSVKDAMTQNYPIKLFDVVVIDDTFLLQILFAFICTSLFFITVFAIVMAIPV